MEVVTNVEPDYIKSLLAYMTTIAKVSIKYTWLSWIVYNQNFQQEMADNALKDWSKVDPSTYYTSIKNN